MFWSHLTVHLNINVDLAAVVAALGAMIFGGRLLRKRRQHPLDRSFRHIDAPRSHKVSAQLDADACTRCDRPSDLYKTRRHLSDPPHPAK